MKISAQLDNPHGPVKVGPIMNGMAPVRTDNFVSLPLKDAHRFIQDIASMYKKGTLTLRDKLIGVSYVADRILYCAKRLEPMPKLDAVRTVPFVIELTPHGAGFKQKILPVSEVRRFGSQLLYGLSEGDLPIEYLFPQG